MEAGRVGGVVDLAEGNKSKARTTWLLQMIVTRWLLVEGQSCWGRGWSDDWTKWMADGGWRMAQGQMATNDETIEAGRSFKKATRGDQSLRSVTVASAWPLQPVLGAWRRWPGGELQPTGGFSWSSSLKRARNRQERLSCPRRRPVSRLVAYSHCRTPQVALGLWRSSASPG